MIQLQVYLAGGLLYPRSMLSEEYFSLGAPVEPTTTLGKLDK